MRRVWLAGAIATLAAAPLGAQRIATLEAGVFAQYTKHDNVTGLTDGVGAGARLGVILCQRVEIEYSADFAPTKSPRDGNITALNNRFDALWNQPIGDNWDFLIGGGFTGTQYQTSTTKNQFDSGANADIGFRRKLNDDWWWRGDALVDFKDPSDQTSAGQRTQTLGLRFGISRLWGGIRKTPNPCSHTPAPPPPAPAPRQQAAPPPAPTPAPAPPPPAPPPAPEPQRAAPAPAPAPPPPAPAPRTIMTFRGVLFAFNKATLTAAARDTVQRAVAYLKEHPDERIEVQGHTDSIGSVAYNQGLSERRANAVRERLISQGIAANRITTKGFGKSEPVADNGTEEGRALNRRVVIIEIP